MTRGEAMRKARLAQGYGLNELADRAGVAHGTLSYLERDISTGNIVTLELLADALGLSVDEYVGHEVIK